MTKRLVKRHKRQVLRAKERVKLSEPDLRTSEELKAAREASRPAGGWGSRAGALYSGPGVQKHAGPASASTAKADG